jgi:hypothetical protein
MREYNNKMLYDYNLLKKYCEENNIILTKDYSKEKVVRNTIIYAKCLNCVDVCSKGFRSFISNGCFCTIHALEKTKEKIKQTCLKKYGVENPLLSEVVKNKIKRLI